LAYLFDSGKVFRDIVALQNRLGLPAVFAQGIGKPLMRQLASAVKLDKDGFFSRIVKVWGLSPKLALKIVGDGDG